MQRQRWNRVELVQGRGWRVANLLAVLTCSGVLVVHGQKEVASIVDERPPVSDMVATPLELVSAVEDSKYLQQWLNEKLEAQADRQAQVIDRMINDLQPSEQSPFGMLFGVVLLILLPVAVWMIVRLLGRKLTKQQAELQNQRLQVEGLREELQHLPRPHIDAGRLADALRPHLQKPAGIPARYESVSHQSPFYNDAALLSNLAQSPLAYLKYLTQVREEVAGLYREFEGAEDPGESLALASWVWCRFHNQFDHRATARWEYLWEVGQRDGYLCDRALSTRLGQSRDPEERSRTLLRAFYRDVLEDGISQHLILLEEMRQLPNFCGPNQSEEACQRLSCRITPMIDQFLKQTRELSGYTPHYVPLFSEVHDEAAHWVRNNGSDKLPLVYQHLTQPRRRVLCVLSYGIRRDRGWESEETQVILT